MATKIRILRALGRLTNDFDTRWIDFNTHTFGLANIEIEDPEMDRRMLCVRKNVLDDF